MDGGGGVPEATVDSGQAAAANGGLICCVCYACPCDRRRCDRHVTEDVEGADDRCQRAIPRSVRCSISFCPTGEAENVNLNNFRPIRKSRESGYVKARSGPAPEKTRLSI